MKKTHAKTAARMGKRPIDKFTQTVLPILRAARRDGATAEVMIASFIGALESVYGPDALAPDRPLARLKLSPRELALHNSFGEAL